MQNILRTTMTAGMMLGLLSFGISDFGAAIAYAGTIKKHHKTYRTEQALPAPQPLNDVRGNAALGGNNANSAYGSNSANENANGRTGGGFGGS
jgi:hypothetical protein